MSKSKIFFDTEFTGLHQKTTLISIGLISECGKTFYAELTDYDKKQVDKWIKENVINNLKLKKPTKKQEVILTQYTTKPGTTLFCGNMSWLKKELGFWLSQFKEVEMWSDCLSYDWVLFCQIFGNAFSIPKNIYYIPFDICTLFKQKGIDPDVDREFFAEASSIAEKHNALWDARVIQKCFNKLQKK